MSTSEVLAGQIMDRVANLLNDPNKTDYTYNVQLPYLNIAIEEYSDLMAEANSSFTNLSSYHWTLTPIIVKAGHNFIVYPEYEQPGYPHDFWARYPDNLTEVQEVEERIYTPRPAPIPPEVLQSEDARYGSYRKLPRKEFTEVLPRTNSLQYWVWEQNIIRFNPPNVDMEVVIKYIYQGIPYATGPNSPINMIGARTYLSYKTAALCAMFIGENETRAAVLEDQAEKAIDRSIGINNKGRQQIMTRHRPFRAAWKSRGGF